ncbi:protein DAY-LENGTH-DEPENDENT DELAYED-GREENING 1, chloroplastic [Aristolochia californica]|uniref:protein DAY-LENGTH-DEPENDENT DELAYED-GREENING 1, chloroplastic n=1 Tax=Aristolochia californica TaxID=171875 RepID=UPI0035D859E1
MFLMSTSMVSCESFVILHRIKYSRVPRSHYMFLPFGTITSGKRRLRLFITNAKNSEPGKRTWWQKFFLDDGNWFGLKEDDMFEEPNSSSEELEGEKLSEEERFEAWRRRAEAIMEIREAQENARIAESREWEDWIVEGSSGTDNHSSWEGDWGEGYDEQEINVSANPNKLVSGKGVEGSIRELILGNEDDLLYEDRVFRYASWSTAKFLALLILIPWAIDFVVHDYVLMPFLDRYVKTVPLAAEMLDVRRNQKLEMIKTLNVEKARFRFEVEIGKSPPLSDEEAWWELRDKALELRDEWRLENRKAFANIWSDMVFGIVLFILMYFNQNKVALLKFTGYKILNNLSDTGKAFLIILITDIFLGYHSESGWETLIEILVEHYGLEVDQSAITIFVCFVPVVLDACVKLWLFKFLPRLSPRVANIFREMKRH